MRGPARPFALAALSFFALACSDAPSGSSATGTARIGLAPSFSTAAAQALTALAAFGLDVTSVHVRLTAPDGSIRDTTLAFPTTSDTLHIEMAVPLRTDGEIFTADLELASADGTVLFSGHQQVMAHAASLPGFASATIIAISYSGPGKDVKTLSVAPGTSLVTGTGSVPVTATGRDASGAAVSSVLVRWTTSDASVATVASTGPSTATVTTTGKRGTAIISAISATAVVGTATIADVPPPARVVVISGSGQTGPAGHALAQPLVVQVQAADNLPVPGAAVTFRAVTTGASVGVAAAVADSNGRASTTLTVGPAAGTYQFEAASGALTPASASESASPAPPASLAYVSGNGQSGTVGTSLAQPLMVRVSNEFGAPVGGATVQWSVLSGTGALSASTSTTAADGSTSITYTLGTTATTEGIRASLPVASGSVFDFSETATASTPNSLSSAGTGQHAPAGSSLPAPLTVLVLDAYRNPVPGVSVVWRVSASTGPTATFAPAISTSDASGSATTVVNVAGTPGSFTVMALVGSLTATFAETGDPSSSIPGTLSGYTYDAVTGSPLSGVSIAVVQGGAPVQTVQTSASGTFLTTQLPAGTYDIQFSVAGYVSTTISALTINGNTVAQSVPLVPSSPTPGGISGFVYDATLNQVVQGTVTLELRGGINATTGTPLQTVTASGGSPYLFSNVAAGTYTIVVIASGYANATKTGIAVGATTTSNQNIYISPVGVSALVRIVLTWRANPRDLDGYLSGPLPNSTSRFLVWYGSRGSLTSAPFAQLDQDVVSGFGPETITISQITPGTYYYSVDKYSGIGPLEQSGARVDVYLNNSLAQSFFVPAGSGNTWNVFSMTGTTITPLNTYGNVLTSVARNVPGISASRAALVQTTTLQHSDADLIAEMSRRHPKSGRRSPQ